MKWAWPAMKLISSGFSILTLTKFIRTPPGSGRRLVLMLGVAVRVGVRLLFRAREEAAQDDKK